MAGVGSRRAATGLGIGRCGGGGDGGGGGGGGGSGGARRQLLVLVVLLRWSGGGVPAIRVTAAAAAGGGWLGLRTRVEAEQPERPRERSYAAPQARGPGVPVQRAACWATPCAARALRAAARGLARRRRRHRRRARVLRHAHVQGARRGHRRRRR